MFNHINTIGSEKQVSTQLELFTSAQITKYFPNQQQNTPFDVQINLLQLAYQMHLSRPASMISESKRTKLMDYSPYIRRITDATHLNFFISDMDDETKQDASRMIGEGISRCLISELFDIQENSIEKIKGPGTRPDFEVITEGEERIICESKGSFNRVSQSEINKAVNIQKVSRDGNLRIAAINNIGVLSRLIDPPIKNEEEDRFSTLITKTNHYIQVFKLAGQQELTKYFKLMKKRFENQNMTNFPEFSDKEELWFKLKYERQRIEVDGKSFIGKVEFVDNNKIIFIGFDKNLLNVSTFESFRDYDNFYMNDTNHSMTFISKDGVCFIEANTTQLQELFPDMNVEEIKNYQESTWLSDIDNMNELEFSEYLKYIFQQNDIEFQREQKMDNHRTDFVFNYEKEKYYLESKLFKGNNQLVYRDKKKSLPDNTSDIRVLEETYDKKIRFLPNIDLKHQILITNKDKRLIRIPKGVIVFDRNELKKLLKNKNYFREFLSQL